MSVKLDVNLPHPTYEGVLYMHNIAEPMSGLMAWEFNGLFKESMSWKQGCYIHGGLCTGEILSVEGPEAKEYLESICVNSFADFPIGSMIHGIMCTEDGLMATHGIIEHIGPDSYRSFVGGPPCFSDYAENSKSFDVKVERLDFYLFQVAGPTSLALLEKLTGENLKDLEFLHQRNSRIKAEFLQSGQDIEVEIARIGMARNLAYELHGPMDDSAEIYEAVFNVGQDFGIERLGWNTYWVNHTEGGFPQQGGHFAPANAALSIPAELAPFVMSGSVDPLDTKARCRTPFEAGWGNLVKFDHDFTGRAAVEAEAANPKRTTVTLRWNSDDVMEVWSSLLKPGEALPLLSMPQAPYKTARVFHQDYIIKDGEKIGYSSGIIYSYFFREFLSLGCIDLDAAQIGTEVCVRWGDFGGNYKDIRATVEPLPYISKGKFGQVDIV